MKTISIVVPIYYNELNLPDSIPQFLALKQKLDRYQLELVFVDDGSGDQSLRILLEYQLQYPQLIKVVKLTRNFGSMAAVQAGMSIAIGDCLAVISADLQDPPELIVDMVSQWEKGVKAVFAIRAEREEPILTKWFSNFFYFLVRRFVVHNYPEGGFDFFLIDRQVVNDVKKIQEKNTNLMTLIFWLGYQAVLIPYVRQRRTKGNSRWNLSKKVKLFIDSFVSFSYFPIRLLSAIGLVYAVVSFLYGSVIIFSRLYYGAEVRGWVSTMVVLTFTAGLQMTMLGVLGEYLWRTLDEVRKRPPYIIDSIYSSTDNGSDESKVHVN